MDDNKLPLLITFNSWWEEFRWLWRMTNACALNRLPRPIKCAIFKLTRRCDIGRIRNH